jgi:hypothetical protein
MTKRPKAQRSGDPIYYTILVLRTTDDQNILSESILMIRPILFRGKACSDLRTSLFAPSSVMGQLLSVFSKCACRVVWVIGVGDAPQKTAGTR